jgi:hypothetical protein
LLKGIGACACCRSRVAAAKNTGGGDGGKADQSHKHVSRRRPALPCRRHRHHFCCGTEAYAFAECRLAVVTGSVAITRSVPPTAKALTFLEMLARFSLRRHRKANGYRTPGLLHKLRLLDEQRPTERRPHLTTRSYDSTKGPRSAHIGLGPSQAALEGGPHRGPTTGKPRCEGKARRWKAPTTYELRPTALHSDHQKASPPTTGAWATIWQAAAGFLCGCPQWGHPLVVAQVGFE